MNRSLRRLWIAGFLIAAFLTVQLAAAAYACMGGLDSNGPMADQAAMTESCPEMAEMAEHAQPDAGKQAGLCHEHCQLNAKSADHYSPQVPAFLPVLHGVVEPTPVSVSGTLKLERKSAVARAPPPQLSILYCCYRT